MKFTYRKAKIDQLARVYILEVQKEETLNNYYVENLFAGAINIT